MSCEQTSETPSSEVQLLGRVKWFNNKAGYGFISVTDGSQSGNEIFVHHSGINVSQEQYRYLVQGEYVQFYLDNTPGKVHAVQAKNVSGINGGMLMCETRRDFKQGRFSYKSEEEQHSTRSAPRERVQRDPRNRGPRGPRGAGPRSDKEWSLVGQT
uniref:CSD domain-containing protein n=1 Tax=viral metagenome TaxID=1070528 RepID=A0A6C0LCZ9_9ZZZZ